MPKLQSYPLVNKMNQMLIANAIYSFEMSPDYIIRELVAPVKFMCYV